MRRTSRVREFVWRWEEHNAFTAVRKINHLRRGVCPESVRPALEGVDRMYLAPLPETVHEVMALVMSERFATHGNPLAEYCFDSVEMRVAPYNPDLVRPDKPQRDRDGKRIDGVPTALMAASAWHLRGEDDQYESAYEKRGVTVA
jgi:hypothetical protein